MEWISVTDRLPKDDTNVLMCEAGQDVMPVFGYYDDTGPIVGFYVLDSPHTIRMHVTHWLPIPELP